MSWTAKIIETNAAGKVLDLYDFEDIVGDFSVENTLGDEQYIKGGDFRFKHNSVLPTGANKYWLALYWDSTMIDVFEIVKPYSDIDLKTGRMSSRLRSISLAVFDYLRETVVAPNYSEIITRIYLTTTDYYDDRRGWHLNVLIQSLAADTGNGFMFGDVSVPGPGAAETDCPIIYRGSSDADLNPAVQKTFTDPDTRWEEIVGLGCVLWNAFVRCTPKFSEFMFEDYLTIDIDLEPRTNRTASGTTAVLWNELSKEFRSKRVDGIYITGPMVKRIYTSNVPDVELVYGFPFSGNVMKKSINLAEFPAWQAALSADGVESQLWICKGDYNSGKYDCDDGALSMAPWFFDGHSLAYYSGMTGDYHDYKGKARYNGERAGDDVIAEGTTHMLITRVSMNRTGLATIEGISIQ